jgi:hypothetical protein
VLVASGGKVGAGVAVGLGVLDGAASAVMVSPDAKVETASVRIASTFTFAVGVSSAGVAPQAVNSKIPTMTNNWVINRNLSISTPFKETRYFTWIFPND